MKDEELSNYLAKAGEEDWENNELKDIVEDFLESLQKPLGYIYRLFHSLHKKYLISKFS